MNKQLFLITVLLFFFINTNAQNFPTGMKYQAVARDNSGNILAEQSINLKITLFSLGKKRTKDVSYIETHQAITNQLGLFSLNIGQGKMESGMFDEVPWSTKEIWMAVDIDSKGGNDFLAISESKLLAVPYALHALTASEIVSKNGTALGKFADGDVWEIGGNLFKPDQQRSLGSIENVDIVLITNNIDRLRILENGNVEVYNDLDVDGQSTTGTLISEGDVTLNSISGITNIEGQTTLNGETTVNGVSTFTDEVNINAPLNVEGDAIIKESTIIHKDLTVGANVDLNIYGNGATNINGPTTIKNNLDVDDNVSLNNASGVTQINGATTIDDILNVSQDVVLNELGGTTLIKGETTVDDNFNVNQNVLLNELGGTTIIKGETTIDDNFNVNQSVLLNELGGTTIIKGETTIDDNFNVNQNVLLNELGGTTIIKGETTIDDNFNVNQSVVLNELGGTTTVKGPALFEVAASFEGPTVFNTIDVQNEVVLNSVGSTTTIKGAAILESTLGVEEATTLNNTLDVNGVTNLNNTFNVNNNKVSNLNGNLNVDGATDLNSSLNVDGVTNLNNTFNVTNAKVSNLNGNLNVDGATDLNNSLNVDGATNLNGNFTINFSKLAYLTGSLDVDGTTDLSDLNVDGVTNLNNTFNVNNSKTSNLTGNLNVDGVTNLNNTFNVTNSKVSNLTGQLNVNGATDLNSSLNVDGVTNLNNTFNVTNSKVSNLTGNLNVGGVTNLKTLNISNTNGNAHVASFSNMGGGNVLSLKTNQSSPNNAQNFITFLNSANNVVGRIEGESSAADLLNNQEYQDDLYFLGVDVALATTGEVIAIAEEIQAGVEVFAASTSSTGCAGLGACVTAPIPSFIVSEAANLILTTANLVLQTADLATVSDNLVTFKATHQALLGITFASGSEDYAEYLPKLNPEEKFMPGDIVGVTNGYITKSTRDAEMIMVISLKPAVLGGLPQDEDVSNLEIVAFMGQVPTKIMGKVNPGDYILASGYHNGFGVAKSPELMQAEDYKKALGIAWEGHDKIEMGFVNTAIGLNSNDLADIVQQQENKINELENQMSILADLVPGFAEAANLKRHDDDEHDHTIKEDLSSTTSPQDLFVQPSIDQIIYFPIDNALLEEGFRLAEEISIKAHVKAGKDINKHPFWSRINTEPHFKKEIMDNMTKELDHAMHTHTKINERIIEKN